METFDLTKADWSGIGCVHEDENGKKTYPPFSDTHDFVNVLLYITDKLLPHVFYTRFDSYKVYKKCTVIPVVRLVYHPDHIPSGCVQRKTVMCTIKVPNGIFTDEFGTHTYADALTHLVCVLSGELVY